MTDPPLSGIDFKNKMEGLPLTNPGQKHICQILLFRSRCALQL